MSTHYTLYKVGNKGLCWEEQNKFSKISYLQWGLNLGPLVSRSDAYLTGKC